MLINPHTKNTVILLSFTCRGMHWSLSPIDLSARLLFPWWGLGRGATAWLVVCVPHGLSPCLPSKAAKVCMARWATPALRQLYGDVLPQTQKHSISSLTHTRKTMPSSIVTSPNLSYHEIFGVPPSLSYFLRKKVRVKYNATLTFQMTRKIFAKSPFESWMMIYV